MTTPTKAPEESHIDPCLHTRAAEGMWISHKPEAMSWS